MNGRLTRRHLALCTVAAALVATLCCGGSDLRVGFDFASNLDLATSHRETRIVNIGLPAARPHMIRGWSYDEKWAGDWAFVWGIWPSSTLEFYTFEPRSTVIRFRCSPEAALVEPSIEVLVNGHSIATVDLRRGFQNYQVRVPSRRLLAGRNELELRYGHAGDGVAPSRDAGRPAVAVAWQRVRMGPEFPYGSVASDGESLEIPFHTRVDYFIDVAAGAKLRWEGAQSWGVSPGQTAPILRVEALYEGSPEPTPMALLTGSEMSAPFIGTMAGGRARVSFLALPGPEPQSAPQGFVCCSRSWSYRPTVRRTRPGEAALRNPARTSPRRPGENRAAYPRTSNRH